MLNNPTQFIILLIYQVAMVVSYYFRLMLCTVHVCHSFKKVMTLLDLICELVTIPYIACFPRPAVCRDGGSDLVDMGKRRR